MNEIQLKQLRGLRIALKNPDPWDNWQFYNAIEQCVELSIVDLAGLSTHFNMSVPSVNRWLRHQNAPHVDVRPRIFKYLQRQATNVFAGLTTAKWKALGWDHYQMKLGDSGISLYLRKNHGGYWVFFGDEALRGDDGAPIRFPTQKRAKERAVAFAREKLRMAIDSLGPEEKASLLSSVGV